MAAPYFVLIYVHSSAVERGLGNLANVGLSGRSSPQYQANSYNFFSFTVQLLLTQLALLLFFGLHIKTTKHHKIKQYYTLIKHNSRHTPTTLCLKVNIKGYF